MIRNNVKHLQQQIHALAKAKKRASLAASGSSNTTRTKSYNKQGVSLDISSLNQVLALDVEKKRVLVEPRVTMEQLVKATLAYGLMPPVVPEFKHITVGGAIMGCAAESGSHKWGIFSDTCVRYELLLGDGSFVTATASENSALYHAIPGSYGTLGLLVTAEIELIQAPLSVRLHYTTRSDTHLSTQTDCVDGIVFSKDLIVQIEGEFTNDSPTVKQWYFEEARKKREVVLPLFDYLFRYDPGAFWMGGYLFNPFFLTRFIGQGLLKLPSKSRFSQKEIEKITPRPTLSPFWRNRLSSNRLWKLHHRAEKWIQNRFLIQDCCMPTSQADRFLTTVMDDPAIYPLWLCPIKNNQATQLFAPHSLSEPILNIGLYGLPAYAAPLSEITRRLEQNTHSLGGRKVLYSRSYYSYEEFWQIYDHAHYQQIRQQSGADGIWPEITEKVLSE